MYLDSAANIDFSTGHDNHLTFSQCTTQGRMEEGPNHGASVSADAKQVTMRFEGGETFVMKTEGQDTTTGYPTLREAIQRTFPTLVRLSQLTEPNRVYGRDHQEKGRKPIGWAQAILPLRA